MYTEVGQQAARSAMKGDRGRAAAWLIGDAAFCPSLFAGQGSALAMAAAYILAGELHKAGGDFRLAFRQDEEIFAPFVRDLKDDPELPEY